MAFDLLTNKVDVVNTLKESATGSIQLPGLTTSIVVPQPAIGYAAVPSAPLIGYSPGAVVQMNLTAGGIAATISVPGAQTVVSNSTGSQLLAFSNDSDAVTVGHASFVEHQHTCHSLSAGIRPSGVRNF